MGVKKIARPINQAKNDFVKWLEKNNANYIGVWRSSAHPEKWDYYLKVDGFVEDTFYSVTFSIWKGAESINYIRDKDNRDNLTVDQFLQLLD